jgi:prevent-host-death family protein
MKTKRVTTLKEKATVILSELADDQEPVLNTQHGRPAAYFVDVESYDAMQNRMQLLEGIARGERAVDEKRIVTHAAAKKRMYRWFN